MPAKWLQKRKQREIYNFHFIIINFNIKTNMMYPSEIARKHGISQSDQPEFLETDQWEQQTISSQPPFKVEYCNNKTIFRLKGSNRIFQLIGYALLAFIFVLLINAIMDYRCSTQYQTLKCTMNSIDSRCRDYLKCFSDNTFYYFSHQTNACLFIIIYFLLLATFKINSKIPHLTLSKMELKLQKTSTKLQ